MNQGFFGFPLSTNVRFLEKAIFDQSGIYEIPRHTSTLLIYAIGAGGGGQGGSARGTVYQGGNGGSGGAHGFVTLFTDEFKYFFDVESNINATQNYLPYKLVITIGAGGTGGAGGAVGANGSNGTAGGDTVISLYSTNAVTGNNIHRLLRLNGGPATTVASRPIINGLAAADTGGGRGASGTGSGKNVIISCPDIPTNVRWNGGAAGGQGNALNDPGGSISLLNASLNTLISLGSPNVPRKGSNTVIISPCDNQLGNCNPNSPQINICGSFSPGYGAGGGFGGNLVSVTGGAGFRGGGGGGGGGNGSGSSPGSSGGPGGNGYVCIVALE